MMQLAHNVLPEGVAGQPEAVSVLSLASQRRATTSFAPAPFAGGHRAGSRPSFADEIMRSYAVSLCSRHVDLEMGTPNRLLAVLLVSFVAVAADAANVKEPADRGNADAGRDLALEACTGCHVVSDDQRFAPLLKAPDFREIANRPNVTAASLRRTIAALPQVPPRGRMANPLLTADQLANVTAYIMTLRERRANQ